MVTLPGQSEGTFTSRAAEGPAPEDLRTVCAAAGDKPASNDNKTTITATNDLDMLMVQRHRPLLMCLRSAKRQLRFTLRPALARDARKSCSGRLFNTLSGPMPAFAAFWHP